MLKRFYGSDEELRGIYENLKLTPCPHCNSIGTLILHGFLRGYDENNPRQKTVRARRIFCSNRKKRNGCGRTFSVWFADKIRRLSLTATSLWKFLKLVVTGDNQIQAIRSVKSGLSNSTMYRIWKRFEKGQTHLRTALANLCPTPDVQAEQPAAQTIAHLQAAFPGEDCPIIAFQKTLQTFFLEPACDSPR